MTLNNRLLLKTYLHQWLANFSTMNTSRESLIKSCKAIEQFMVKNTIKSLWCNSPILLTATLDDALGYGLDIIEKFSSTLGMTVTRIGLMVEPKTIIEACQNKCPDFLGMTVLQFDSEDELQMISKALPEKTCFIAGGPLFKQNSNFARNCGIHVPINSVEEYIHYLLNHDQGEMK